MTGKNVLILGMIFAIAILASFPVSAHVPYYESKYVDVNITADLSSDIWHSQGLFIGQLRDCINTQNPYLYVTNDADPDANKAVLAVPINDAGKWEQPLVPGNYTVTLPNGNGGATEVAHVFIQAQHWGYEYPHLMGHAVSADTSILPKEIPQIVRATYGIIVLVFPEVDQTQYKYIVTPASQGTAAYCSDARYSTKDACQDHGKTWHAATPGTLEVDSGWVVTVPAGKTTIATRSVIITPAIYSGANIDVTSNVQTVANEGYTTFLFDNAHNPGGIFTPDYSKLLSTITDPSYGNVKDVKITYTLGGTTKTITTKEYQVINLN